MTTITPQKPQAPSAIFRVYRGERQSGKPAEDALSATEQRMSSGSSEQWDRWREQLVEDEQHFGLVDRDPEPEPEPVEPEPTAIDAIRADAQKRLGELETQRSRLAPEALVSADAKAELADVENEIAAARQAIELADLADAETARREQQAREDAEAEQKAQALARATALQAERHKLALAADKAVAKYVEQLVALRDVCASQAAEYQAAGRSASDARNYRYNPERAGSALRAALLTADATGLLRDVGFCSLKDQPLAAGRMDEA